VMPDVRTCMNFTLLPQKGLILRLPSNINT
jgi:hypothetical protein